MWDISRLSCIIRSPVLRDKPFIIFHAINPCSLKASLQKCLATAFLYKHTLSLHCLVTVNCDGDAYQKSSLSSAERLCKRFIDTHPLSLTSFSIPEQFPNFCSFTNMSGTGGQSLETQLLTLRALIMSEKWPPIAQCPFHRAVKMSLCHFSSRERPLASRERPLALWR